MPDPLYGIGVRRIRLVNVSRPMKPFANFAGAPTRRLDLIIWYPTTAAAKHPTDDAPMADGAWPLAIYSHGTFGHAGNASYLAEDLARHGYIVAAPNYPLTSRTSFTQVERPDLADVVNQIKDLSFIIDQLLLAPVVSPAIDPQRIATVGHSLGAVTSYFASFGLTTRDPRIAATLLIAAGDPVQAALSADMGLAGTYHAAVLTPTLFVSAEKDLFARMTGRPHAAYSRLESPKYEVMIKDGVHVWFCDGNDLPADGRNPDCLFFEQQIPNMPLPGCEEPTRLIDPARQKGITAFAARTFLDAYLKSEPEAHTRLLTLAERFADINLLAEQDLH